MADKLVASNCITLKPLWDTSRNITTIQVTLDIGGLYGGLQGGSQRQQSSQNQVKCDFGNNLLNNIIVKIEKDNITVNVRSKDPKINAQAVPAWNLEQSIGAATIQYDVKPSVEFSTDDIPNFIDGQNGLICIGRSMFPAIEGFDENDSFSLAWDFSESPQGTKGVTSFGEGTTLVSGPPSKLLDSIFAIGQINFSSPAESASPTPDPLPCATYWLGDLPPNLESVKDFTTKMFPRVSMHFRDGPHNAYYRLFLRKVPRGGLKGTPLRRSSLVDYDEDSQHETDWEIVRTLNQSMISTWTIFDVETDDIATEWYTQGLSRLYTIYLPFRFGQRPPDYFRATLNGYLSAYFTNPHMNTPLHQLLLSASTSWHAATAFNMRSLLYFIRTDSLTRRSTRARDGNIERPIDEIVADIWERQQQQRAGAVLSKDWIEAVAEWIGQDVAAEEFERLMAGTMKDLKDMETAYGRSLVLEEQNELEMGFDRTSLDSGVVNGVRLASAAWNAGLRDGDNILKHSRVEYCETHYDEDFKLQIDRKGQKLEISYRPRSDKVVPVWQSRKKA